MKGTLLKIKIIQSTMREIEFISKGIELGEFPKPIAQIQIAFVILAKNNATALAANSSEVHGCPEDEQDLSINACPSVVRLSVRPSSVLPSSVRHPSIHPSVVRPSGDVVDRISDTPLIKGAPKN